MTRKRQDKILLKRRIGAHDASGKRVPSLVGQYAVFSQTNLPANVVLGMYVGMEFELEQWEDVFQNTNVSRLHQKYLYSYSLDDHSSICIDPVQVGGLERDSKLLFINDCRRELDTNVSQQDCKVQNCEFVEAYVNHRLFVFVRTTKPINAQEELLLDYGDSYGKQMLHQEQCHKETIRNVKIMCKQLRIEVDNLKDDKIGYAL